MNSRDAILQRVKENQPPGVDLPALLPAGNLNIDIVEKFKTVLVGIGGAVIEVSSKQHIKEQLQRTLPQAKSIISICRGLEGQFNAYTENGTPHALSTMDVAILEGTLAVAENGAVWITDHQMGDRALPFICHHLCLVVSKKQIIPTLHEAYEIIGDGAFAFGTFIAGPSKTADIEQSLVLGAHGPKSLIIFLTD